MSDTLRIDLVSGVEGPSLYLNDYRVAGNKPWGGGHLQRTWIVNRADIERALTMPVHERKEEHA